MKILIMRPHFYLTVLVLLAGTTLSAQNLRFLADGGGIFPSENRNGIGATGHLGLELLVPVAPETYLTFEAGTSYRSHRILSNAANFDAEPFINGLRIASFAEFETYRAKSHFLISGVGIEQHVNRLRAQLSGRIGYRVSEQVNFREETVFDAGRPMNVFDVEVASGERFAKGMQTHQIDLNKPWRFQLGTSVRYALTKRLEVGLSTYYDLGNYRVERRIVSFCDNCPVNANAAPERSIRNRGIELLLTTRYVL